MGVMLAHTVPTSGRTLNCSIAAQARPTRKLPMAVPSKLPSPPRTMTAMLAIRKILPRLMVAPRKGALTAPPKAAKAQPKVKTSVNTAWTLMPKALTISASCTPARMVMPRRERRSKVMTTAMTSKPMTMTNKR